MNIALWQREQARTYGTHVGLVFHGRELTNEALYDDARRVAGGLIQLGFAPGDRAIIALPNSAELFTACSAVWMAGGVVVVLGDVPQPALERAGAHCAPTLIARRDGGAGHSGTAWFSASGRREANWLELASAHPLSEPLPRDAAALAQLCYTSGTTSQPKAVAYTHGGIDAFRRMFASRPGAAATSPTLLLALPPTAFGANLIGARCTGNLRYVVLERFDAQRTLAAIEQHRATELPLVPAMAEQLVACGSREASDLSSLLFVTVSGAHVSAELVARLRRRLSSPAFAGPDEPAERVGSPMVIVAYGMSETGGCASTASGGDGVVGTTIPGAEVRIVDASGAALQRGQQGEIVVRTPYAAAGYWNDPAETARVFRDGFVHSGDLGRFNERGELCVLGRLKEMIIQGGQNICPEEIASIVRSCNGVTECACVGVDDDLLGEAAVACVVRKVGTPVTEGEIHAHCRRYMDARKLPTHVLFFDALPRNEAGKLAVAELQALVEVRLTATQDGTLTKRLQAADRDARIALLESMIEESMADALPEGAGPAEPHHAWRPFGERGLDSIGVVRVAHMLGKRLGQRVSPTLLFTYPSAAALARHFAEPTRDTGSPCASPAESQDIAIIGIGCRLPGGAGNASDFWTLLANGVDTVGQAPSYRSQDAEWRACFVDEIDRFDARFFGLAAEAAELDPRHRMVLEVGWEALEDAGIDPNTLARRKTGVFLGVFGERYRSPSALGAATGMAIARLCHFLDVRGPALSIDTTCSSSLVATHEGLESLRRGECELALCGGANLLAAAIPAASGLAAADGRSKAFDARADGLGQGEGCVFVVLERVADALERGDRIYAVIRGSAVNHDGRSSSLTAPNVLAQDDVLRSALRRARVHPDQVQYIETHGTGTRLGDPVEVEALARVFSGRERRPLRIGSVKTNVGHLEAAAGITGLVKLALAIFHRCLPASLHFGEPNPLIPWASIPIRVQDTFSPWPSDNETLISGVSSFGMSGTNAHVVLAAAPTQPLRHSGADASRSRPYLLPLSARSTAALRAHAMRFATMLESRDADASAVDIGYTASCRRTHFEHRIALVGASRAEWAQQIRAFLRSASSSERAPSAKVAVAMVFSGQGMPTWSTTRALLREEPVFSEALERCAAEIGRHVSWRLLEELPRVEPVGAIAPTDIAQPAIFALQASLYALWRSWGIEPRAVTGHSLGEIAAAYASGALSLEDAARLACVRGRIMQKAAGSGTMAHARMTLESAEDFVREAGEEIEVAADNGPYSITLTGTAAAIERVVALLSAKGVAAQILPVDYAFHSAAVERFRAELATELRDIAWTTPRLPLISTATGGESPAVDAAYWASQMRCRVRFHAAIRALLERGCTAFIEIGARPVLRSAIEDIARTSKVEAMSVSAQPREGAGRRGLLEALARLYRFGYPVDWSRQYTHRGRVVALPSYPWEHRRYWHEPPASVVEAPMGPLVQSRRSASAGADNAYYYESRIDLKDPSLAYLAGHRVLGEIWLPAAAVLEAVREAAAHDQDSKHVRLAGIKLENALVLAVDHPQTLQIRFFGAGDLRRFEVRVAGDGANALRVASGELRRERVSTEWPVVSLADVQRRCTQRIEPLQLRIRLTDAGFAFDDDFMGVEAINASGLEAIARLQPTARIAATADRYGVHPAILDSAFRLCAAVLPTTTERDVPHQRLALPTHLTSFTVMPNARATWAYVRASAQGEGWRFDVALCDEAGRVVVNAEGLYVDSIDYRNSGERHLYAVEWQRAAPPENRRGGGVWIVLGDRSGVGASLRADIESRGGRTLAIDAADAYRDAARLQQLLRDVAANDSIDGIVSMSALDADNDGGDAPDVVAAARVVALAKLARAMGETAWNTPPKLVIVTRGAQPADGTVPGLEQAALWGFGATLALERPDWRVKLIDLDPSEPARTTLCDELSDDRQQRVALRGTGRLTPAVVRHRSVRTAQPSSILQVGASGYEATVAHPGSLDSADLRRVERRAPPPNELEIRVHATALNFRDVLIALGRYPDDRGIELLGGECAGVVTRVGEGVAPYAVGDEVVAIGGSLLRSFATLPVSQVRPKPPFLSFPQAASMSVAFVTALFALEHVARVRPGERVLIHAATGGVGLAAIQHCRRIGAEVFATAGSERKRDLLRSMGITHVFASRDLSWVDGVMSATGGGGVDVILNSLSGESLRRGFETLAAGGRFIELGKHDIHDGTSISLAVFRRNATFSAASLDVLSPHALRHLHQETWRRIDARELAPLPIEQYPVSQLQHAFAQLAGAKHIGKVVVTAEDAVPVVSADDSVVRADRTYLVSGGLGALGLVAAARLARCGARNLVLIGRNPPRGTAIEAIAKLARDGVTVHVATVDVCNRDSLVALLDDVAAKLPPLAGLVHCAGILHDATAQSLDDDALRSVLAAKTTGAWNLHLLTRNLDFFVMFSSVAGVFGNAGQANYAAANAFLDALAHYRRDRGLPALSIGWGAWEIGMAAAVLPSSAQAFDENEGADVFEALLLDRAPHVLAVKGVELRLARLSTDSGGRPTLGEHSVEHEVRSSIGELTDLQTDTLAKDDTLSALGIDSLATIRLRARIAERLDVTLTSADLGPDITLAALVRSVEAHREQARPTPAAHSEPLLRRQSADNLIPMHGDKPPQKHNAGADERCLIPR